MNAKSTLTRLCVNSWMPNLWTISLRNARNMINWDKLYFSFFLCHQTCLNMPWKCLRNDLILLHFCDYNLQDWVNVVAVVHILFFMHFASFSVGSDIALSFIFTTKSSKMSFEWYQKLLGWHKFDERERSYDIAWHIEQYMPLCAEWIECAQFQQFQWFATHCRCVCAVECMSVVHRGGGAWWHWQCRILGALEILFPMDTWRRSVHFESQNAQCAIVCDHVWSCVIIIMTSTTLMLILTPLHTHTSTHTTNHGQTRAFKHSSIQAFNPFNSSHNIKWRRKCHIHDSNSVNGLFVVFIDSRSHQEWIRVWSHDSNTNQGSIAFWHKQLVQYWIPNTHIQVKSNYYYFFQNCYVSFCMLMSVADIYLFIS